MSRIDLDDLSGAYRHRPITEAGERRARISASGLSGMALDLGGGTGSHALVLADAGLDPVVVDLNASMCQAARARSVATVRATNERLPFRDRSVCLAYSHLSIHYGDWKLTLDEAARVVERGGRIDIWTFGPDAVMRSSLARWFPTVGQIDRERFPDPAQLRDHLEGTCEAVAVETHDDTIERRAGDWVEAVRAKFVSTLQLVEPDEIERGLEQFVRHHPDPDDTYRYVLEYRRITAVV